MRDPSCGTRESGVLHTGGLTAIGSQITVVGGSVTKADASAEAAFPISAEQEVQPTPVLRWTTINGTYEFFSERLAWRVTVQGLIAAPRLV
jgi:hypothetical protein